MLSDEHKIYLKKGRIEKCLILFAQISIVLLVMFLWEYLSRKEIINPFIFSSPSNIVKTIKTLFLKYHLISHIFTTLFETIIAFSIGIIFGLIIATIMYFIPRLAKIIEPFLTIINSLPKIALGPIIIIWVGASTKSIITMALLINLIISILTIYNGFLHTDNDKIFLLKTFGANKRQIFKNLVFMESLKTIISSLKINISMTLIGVIMGEFLVSKKGLGYLIIYGTQVFNLNIVMACILLLIVISGLLYGVISKIEKIAIKNH